MAVKERIETRGSPHGVGGRMVRHDAVDKAGGVLRYASDDIPRNALGEPVRELPVPPERVPAALAARSAAGSGA